MTNGNTLIGDFNFSEISAIFRKKKFQPTINYDEKLP